MILIYGSNPVGNIIHAIIGPESEVWADLHGALTVDITALLKLCDANSPVLLNITACDNESTTLDRLRALISSGAQYPFLPNTVLMAPQNQKSVNEQAKVQPDSQLANNATASEAKTVVLHVGKCSRCSNESAELVPNITPAICFGCAKIDLYRARMETPGAWMRTASGDNTHDATQLPAL